MVLYGRIEFKEVPKEEVPFVGIVNSKIVEFNYDGDTSSTESKEEFEKLLSIISKYKGTGELVRTVEYDFEDKYVFRNGEIVFNMVGNI